MPYFTTLTLGDQHEPKTLICAHHSYNENNGKTVVNIFDYTVEKQDRSGEFKPLKWSKEAVKTTLKAHFWVFGINNDKTEKL